VGPELHFQNFGIIVTSVSAEKKKEGKNESVVAGAEHSARTVATCLLTCTLEVARAVPEPEAGLCCSGGVGKPQRHLQAKSFRVYILGFNTCSNPSQARQPERERAMKSKRESAVARIPLRSFR